MERYPFKSKWLTAVLRILVRIHQLIGETLLIRNNFQLREIKANVCAVGRVL